MLWGPAPASGRRAGPATTPGSRTVQRSPSAARAAARFARPAPTGARFRAPSARRPSRPLQHRRRGRVSLRANKSRASCKSSKSGAPHLALETTPSCPWFCAGCYRPCFWRRLRRAAARFGASARGARAVRAAPEGAPGGRGAEDMFLFHLRLLHDGDQAPDKARRGVGLPLLQGRLRLDPGIRVERHGGRDGLQDGVAADGLACRGHDGRVSTSLLP